MCIYTSASQGTEQAKERQKKDLGCKKALTSTHTLLKNNFSLTLGILPILFTNELESLVLTFNTELSLKWSTLVAVISWWKSFLSIWFLMWNQVADHIIREYSVLSSSNTWLAKPGLPQAPDNLHYIYSCISPASGRSKMLFYVLLNKFLKNPKIISSFPGEVRKSNYEKYSRNKYLFPEYLLSFSILLNVTETEK